MLEKYAKIRHICPYGGTPGGTVVPCYTFLERSRGVHVTLRLTVFEILQLNGQNLGPKLGILGIPYGSARKGEKTCYGTHIYHHAKFHADRWHRRRDIWSHTKNRHSRFNKIQTKRIY